MGIFNIFTMKHWINRFLNKKSDFTEDRELSTLNDQFFYLLGEEKRLLNVLLKRNMKYYFTHKKLYLLKIFIIGCIYFAVGVGVVGGTLFGLDYFNVVDIKAPSPRPNEQLTIYMPESESGNFNKLRKQFKEINIDLTIMEFFPPDPKKDWKAFKKAISRVESGGSYTARDGQYWGKYQLGEEARKAAGVGSATWEQFSSNPDMQEGAFLSWMRLTKKQVVQYNLYRYMGRYVRGYQITESGLMALTHNVGIGGAIQYLKSGGDSIPAGNPTAFIRLGGYNLNLD